MTPYAVLLVKPTDADETIRKAYHKQAEVHHPDANGGAASPQWYVATAAYTAIKTAEKRTAWQRQQDLLAKKCGACDGVGVRGTRMFGGKVRLCSECSGAGVV